MIEIQEERKKESELIEDEDFEGGHMQLEPMGHGLRLQHQQHQTIHNSGQGSRRRHPPWPGARDHRLRLRRPFLGARHHHPRVINIYSYSNSNSN